MVPSPGASPLTEPEPRSWSALLRVSALVGEKKSPALTLPSAARSNRTSDCARVAGGAEPGPTGGKIPLPVEKNRCPAPSEDRPPPACQIPPFGLDTTVVASVVHRLLNRGVAPVATDAT